MKKILMGIALYIIVLLIPSVLGYGKYVFYAAEVIGITLLIIAGFSCMKPKNAAAESNGAEDPNKQNRRMLLIMIYGLLNITYAMVLFLTVMR